LFLKKVYNKIRKKQKIFQNAAKRCGIDSNIEQKGEKQWKEL
jgi:hypothetical protein